VLIAIILGTEIAGVVGTLAAIPVAGAIQVIINEVGRWRTERNLSAVAPPDPATP
jgi:predicted PurR-regulated permease PerM